HCWGRAHLPAPRSRQEAPDFTTERAKRRYGIRNGRPTERLLLHRYAHDQPVQRVGERHLAGQPAGRLAILGEVEHLVFDAVGLAGRRDPVRVHIDMAGRAGTTAAAFGDDTRHHVGNGRILHGAAHGRLDGAAGAVGLDEGNARHSSAPAYASAVTGSDASRIFAGGSSLRWPTSLRPVM